MIAWVNAVSSAVVLGVCVWAVLHPRVETRIVGTLSLSSLGLFSALNILRPGSFGMWATESQTLANASLACLFLWGYVRYQRILRAKRGQR